MGVLNEKRCKAVVSTAGSTGNPGKNNNFSIKTSCDERWCENIDYRKRGKGGKGSGIREADSDDRGFPLGFQLRAPIIE